MIEKKVKPPSLFAQKIYLYLKTVPKGRVTTYKELARVVHTRAYRAIGQVMRCNPYAPEVPCHRVVASDGKIGGFFGSREGEAIEIKINLLKKEGVTIKNGRVEEFEKKLFKFV